MRPKNKGWILKYADHLQRLAVEIKYEEQLKGHLKADSYEENFYRLIQPTGLMYGHPVQHPGSYDLKMKSWDEKEKVKFILFDSFVHNAFLVNEVERASDLKDLVYDSVKELVDFYKESFPHKDMTRDRSLTTDRNELLMAENLIKNRMNIRYTLGRNFWAGFFHNSLLFLDVYFYGMWLQNKKGIVNLRDFDKIQENLRLCILKIIASAAYADNQLELEERRLFTFFVKSAELQPDKEKEAMEFLDSKISIDEIEFPELDSWVLRKYLLELATLTIWADKEVNEAEKHYLERLGKKLGFSTEELDSSLLAIESFVITNWEQVHFLQSKHNFHIVKDRFTSRMAFMLNKNKKAIEKEIKESRELMALLRKGTKENLTPEEKIVVKAQLLDILKTIPTFVIIALPFTFITLPVMLKMLPRSAFPSAFSEED